MKIANNKVVKFHYALVNADGEVLDGSRGGEPLPYLHGHKNIVPGLEQAMLGHSVGDKFKIKVSPEQGYGLRDEDKVSLVERASFEGFTELAEGMVCQMEDEQGDLQLVSITKIDEEEVTVDANHPFAGLELNFDVEIMDIRDATEDELSAGRIEL
ncbi:MULTISPECIES: peptidylprolyl isomerase [unclassified Neptuniibacter]|jgi:FKBP-type peptidyl-prolyl cis-trans isomerase SlyD|uniref:FKBP-type peptidyl-prolyl cis-trans isomerase n=1 Tax=unclassified Neptuniibacter TaxID=2630693 RepID=UPI0026E1214F|nr:MULTISPECIES: peptidylprolyl isomerase [unclassified Neptuniibacter]MDO6515055.1 peptidylprolyl isomerase [Neptuniibacter sp. 2_MG-2023]MDO6594886.1 peptidylprolyl isomerase [Neptuniibacter sp. 1_MG-2023]